MKLPRFRETHDDDERRTKALLNALDEACESRPDPMAPLDDFETVVLFGVAGNPAAPTPYPPAGHTYPKRG
ncbi:hypothetical protein [Streptomyces sp. NPDC048224]|uniref:hypothetical protein n=1 Tax=Streptomyces sp. NPDC048224 TaxID=3154500 RepID=UPI0033E2A17A